MNLSTWLFYLAAVLVLTVTPGPSVLMSISTSVQYGPRRAVFSSLGSTTAIAGIMCLSMLGLGTVLAASEPLFQTVKWLGAGYLAYLGIAAFLSKSSAIAVPDATPALGGANVSARPPNLFVRGFLVGASNPKALLFFGALFPQFIDPSLPQGPQFLVLSVTFICLELFWLFTYALTAARARRWLQQPNRATWFNRATGTIFLIAASLLALSKRNAA